MRLALLSAILNVVHSAIGPSRDLYRLNCPHDGRELSGTLMKCSSTSAAPADVIMCDIVSANRRAASRSGRLSRCKQMVVGREGKDGAMALHGVMAIMAAHRTQGSQNPGSDAP